MLYTVSIGGASCVPQKIDQLHHLLQIADEALYQAKRADRNQVVMASPEY